MVTALMSMSNAKSARDNVVRPLRQLGLIDEDGALTVRGNKWSLDSSYGDACQEILDEIYPDELAGLTDDAGHPNQEMVKIWFQQQRFGESNATSMAATYVRIAEKQVPEQPGTGSGTAKKPRTTKPTSKSPEAQDTEKPLESGSGEPPAPPVKSTGGPAVHLNIEIHIPADATPEKIDQIFSSMAKHLYTK